MGSTLKSIVRSALCQTLEDGQFYGKYWAEADDGAALNQLIRLRARWLHCDQREWEWAWAGDDNSAYSPAEKLFFTIEPDQHGDRSAARDFWDTIFGRGLLLPRHLNSDFVRGFAEGAIEVRNAQVFGN
jgi:hypothetical protein